MKQTGLFIAVMILCISLSGCVRFNTNSKETFRASADSGAIVIPCRIMVISHISPEPLTSPGHWADSELQYYDIEGEWYRVKKERTGPLVIILKENDSGHERELSLNGYVANFYSFITVHQKSR